MTNDEAPPVPRPSKLLSYLRLFRAPNVFTAAADVAMGFVFVNASIESWIPLVCLLGASCLLYTAGMVLNDVFDFETDARERPDRPIPSGQISLAWARWLGFEFLVIGVVLGWCAGFADVALSSPWRSGAVATCLAACVLLYDGVLKNTVVAPLAMGACRFFNVLLGMSVGAVAINGTEVVAGFAVSHLMVAGGIGLYISGVTWFARTEAKTSNRGLLIWGTALMAAGIGMLALFPMVQETQIAYRLDKEYVWPMVLFMLTFTILRRCVFAIITPQPNRVQAAVKQCIFSIIVLDATVCLFVADWFWAVAVLALLAPMLLFGKWVYST
jgi:4-hydroxybenzoate polyprenyltransferase